MKKVFSRRNKKILVFFLAIILALFSNIAISREITLLNTVPAILFLFLAKYDWVSNFNAFIFMLLVSIYLPNGLLYGMPNDMIFASAIYTNPEEINGYTKTLPFASTFLCVLCLILTLVYTFIRIRPRRTKNNRFPWYASIVLWILFFVPVFYNTLRDGEIVLPIVLFFKNNTVWPFILLVFLVFFIYTTITKKVVAQRFSIGLLAIFFFYASSSLSKSYLLNSVSFFLNANHNFKDQQTITKTGEWQIADSTLTKKNYVVIIGESARKDYHSVYGYPLKTTPFMDTVKGTFVDGFVSAAPNTAQAIPRLLSLTTQKLQPNLHNNIIGLANKLNLKTFWISNQAKHALFDPPATMIANHADYSTFVSDVTGNNNNSDTLLVPLFKKYLDVPVPNKRLMVMHLYGSHEPPKLRLFGRKTVFKTNVSEDLDNYLTTLYYTDQLIQKVYTYLKEKKEPFSIIYFPDHGLDIYKKDEKASKFSFKKKNLLPVIMHNGIHKQNYDIPLVIINSDSPEHEVIHKKISGYHMMDVYAYWLGAKTNLTTPISLRNYKETPIQVFNGEKNVPYDSLKELPAIMPEQ